MATLDQIRKAIEWDIDPDTGVEVQTDLSATAKASPLSPAEVVSLSPPMVELLDGSVRKVRARVAGINPAVGDLVLVQRFAKWVVVVGPLEVL